MIWQDSPRTGPTQDERSLKLRGLHSRVLKFGRVVYINAPHSDDSQIIDGSQLVFSSVEIEGDCQTVETT